MSGDDNLGRPGSTWGCNANNDNNVTRDIQYNVP